MKIVVKTFKELTQIELYKVLQLRSEVFVVEQDCVYQDIDGRDQKAYHVLGYSDNNLVAYTRFFAPCTYAGNTSFGRVVVKLDYRRYGYGKEMVAQTISAIQKRYGKQPIEISAQAHLTVFYQEFGFQQEGEGYLEDGIPHIKMIRHPKE